MTTFSRLIATATLIGATAFSPGPAAADGRHERPERRDGREEPCDQRDPGGRLQAPPAWATRDDLRWDGRDRVHAGWDLAERIDRLAQARAVRHELLLLEWERADFHARFANHPRRLARFDAHYVLRRDQLERRLQWVTLYAWR
jgi:hypothetical protein